MEIAMSALRKSAKPILGLLAAVACSAMLSMPAQAETNWPWYDPAVSAPNAAAPRLTPARRGKLVRAYSPAPAAAPMVVSAATPPQSEGCFWCNRRVYISGLSF
jgi:hypothetical protein